MSLWHDFGEFEEVSEVLAVQAEVVCTPYMDDLGNLLFSRDGVEVAVSDEEGRCG
jgi:hypothetical protein